MRGINYGTGSVSKCSKKRGRKDVRSSMNEGLIEDGITYNKRREPQPHSWNALIEARDGALTRPSVVIFRSTLDLDPVDMVAGATLNKATRKIFEQEVPQDKEGLEAFGLEKDEFLNLARACEGLAEKVKVSSSGLNND